MGSERYSSNVSLKEQSGTSNQSSCHQAEWTHTRLLYQLCEDSVTFHLPAWSLPSSNLHRLKGLFPVKRMTRSGPSEPWIVFVLTGYHRVKMESVSAGSDTSDNLVQPGEDVHSSVSDRGLSPQLPEMVQAKGKRKIFDILRVPPCGGLRKHTWEPFQNPFPC